jgi:hypothetical protein
MDTVRSGGIRLRFARAFRLVREVGFGRIRKRLCGLIPTSALVDTIGVRWQEYSMKTLPLLIAFVLSATVVFADNLSSEFSKFEQKEKPKEKFEYKSKPRIHYQSREPAKDNLGLERLKPMLHQVMGNTQGGTDVPNSGGTLHF